MEGSSGVPTTTHMILPEKVDTLFFNDVEEEFLFFFRYLYLFSAQISNNCRRLQTPSSLLLVVMA